MMASGTSRNSTNRATVTGSRVAIVPVPAGSSRRSWSATMIAVAASTATEARIGKARPTRRASARSAASGGYSGPANALATRSSSRLTSRLSGGADRLEGRRPGRRAALRDEAHFVPRVLEDARGDRGAMPGPAEHGDRLARGQLADSIRQVRDEDLARAGHD